MINKGDPCVRRKPEFTQNPLPAGKGDCLLIIGVMEKKIAALPFYGCPMTRTDPYAVIGHYRIAPILLPWSQQILRSGHADSVGTVCATTARSSVDSIEVSPMTYHADAFHEVAFPSGIIPEQLLFFANQCRALFVHLLRPNRSWLAYTIRVLFPDQVKLS